MIIAQGNKTYMMKLQRKHVDEMQNWGVHHDPLFSSYSFPQMTKSQMDYWFYKKNYTLTRRCFVVFNNENKLVGYIALRDINWFCKTSEMGIVFDPNYLSQGYGTDALKSFIPYYFSKMKMKKLKLRVAEFNARAQRCYEKCGFIVKNRQLNEFEDQTLAIASMANYLEYFKLDKGILKCKYLHMDITREIYQQRKERYPHYPPNTCA